MYTMHLSKYIYIYNAKGIILKKYQMDSIKIMVIFNKIMLTKKQIKKINNNKSYS